MRNDPIVEEIRKARRSHALKFDNNLTAIVADIRRLEHESGRVFVTYPPRRLKNFATNDFSSGDVERASMSSYQKKTE